jgi:hypothetical protein
VVRSKLNNFGWRVFGPNRYDGWIFGKFNSEGFPIQGNGTAYIYHDMTTVLLGTILNDAFVEGRPARAQCYKTFYDCNL